jgi:hypothetical protein
MTIAQWYAFWGSEQTEGVDEALQLAGLPTMEGEQPVSSVLPRDWRPPGWTGR